jgi:hypothetical protein
MEMNIVNALGGVETWASSPKASATLGGKNEMAARLGVVLSRLGYAQKGILICGILHMASLVRRGAIPPILMAANRHHLNGYQISFIRALIRSFPHSDSVYTRRLLYSIQQV